MNFFQRLKASWKAHSQIRTVLSQPSDRIQKMKEAEDAALQENLRLMTTNMLESRKQELDQALEKSEEVLKRAQMALEKIENNTAQDRSKSMSLERKVC